jgi:predicted acylesterase/phospholipase RssA
MPATAIASTGVPEDVVPRTAFVLAGGGFRGAFEVGAMQHLIDDLGIRPDVISAASAGAMFGVIVAQGRDRKELSRYLDQARRGLLGATGVEKVFGRQPLLDDLGGTSVAESVRRALDDRMGPDLPGGEPDPEAPEAQEDPGAPMDRRSRYRRTWEDLGSLVQVIPAVRRARRSGAPPAVLNLDPWELSIRGRGPIEMEAVDPALVARPGLDLRMAVTAVRARETHYVCGDGTIVGPDALTPIPVPDPEHDPNGNANGNGNGNGNANGNANGNGNDNGRARGNRSTSTTFDVIDGAVASGSIPGVLPPRRLGDVTYVDGGVLQNVPLEAAVALEATRIFTVLAVPLSDPQRGLSRWAARELGLVSTQQDNLRVDLPAGTTNTVIEPTVEIVGSLEVHPGLMAIAIDYGRMRAEEALAESDPGLRALCTAASDAVSIERARAWRVERACLRAGEVSPARLDALLHLKDCVRRAVAARTALGFPDPPGADRWWQGWELHSTPIPSGFQHRFDTPRRHRPSRSARA